MTGIKPKGVPLGKKIARRFKRWVRKPINRIPMSKVKANDKVKMISAVVVVE